MVPEGLKQRKLLSDWHCAQTLTQTQPVSMTACSVIPLFKEMGFSLLSRTNCLIQQYNLEQHPPTRSIGELNRRIVNWKTSKDTDCHDAFSSNIRYL